MLSLDFDINFDKLQERVNSKKWRHRQGKVTEVVGLTMAVKGIEASVGEICLVRNGGSTILLAEVMGFKGDKLYLMPLGDLSGINLGALIVPTGGKLSVRVGDSLRGRVLDGIGRVMDGGQIGGLEQEMPLTASPPNPLSRLSIDKVFETGIKAVDGLLTCGQGQRLGIFSGSGVGKSTLLGMLAKNSSADINVIGLIGERGREVRNFIERDLGSGLAKSVVVAATSDQPALLRIKAAYTTTAIAEYYRSQGYSVLLLMDSVTRFAMAQREVGLAIGEPPATRGYPPSVFALLPQLLERSGTAERGSITAFYTVLVDGDDMNEPIADTVRGILDGHIVLSRNLAEQGQFPAIDILQSISRLMPGLIDEEHRSMAEKIRRILTVWRQNEDLISIGAYQRGTSRDIDMALDNYPRVTEALRQREDELVSFEKTLGILSSL